MNPTSPAVNREPHEYPRRILLLVTGLTPQVLTETLYALTQTRKPAFEPTEIHLLSTSIGVEGARLELLHPQEGWYYKLCEDYQLDNSTLTESGLHCICDADGRPVEDLRSESDHIAAADTITEMIRRFTADPDAALHVSIAGGRKTQSFYAGYALSLFGRQQDRMSHVLVSAAFESNRHFFYPTPYSRRIHATTPDQRPCDTHKAVVNLTDIPFIRLRNNLTNRALHQTASFADTVQTADNVHHEIRLIVDEDQGLIRCGDTLVRLQPLLFALYAWFAFCRMHDLPPLKRKEYTKHLRDILDFYPKRLREDSGHLERLREQEQQGVTPARFDTQRTRINDALHEQLGQRGGQLYGIQSWGNRPKTYGLDIPANRIQFKRIDTQ